MVLPSVRKRTRSGNRKGPRRGPAGQPRAQALGSVAGPDVRPEWAVQAASAFPGWHPGRPCRQGSRAGLSCSTLCMINVVTQLFKGKIPVVGSFSLLLSLCECLWKCAKTWDVEQKLPQKNTGGRKRSPFELRARPEGRSSARTPGSSRTGPCPRRSRTYRCKGERLGCGITLGGLP